MTEFNSSSSWYGLPSCIESTVMSSSPNWSHPDRPDAVPAPSCCRPGLGQSRILYNLLKKDGRMMSDTPPPGFGDGSYGSPYLAADSHHGDFLAPSAPSNYRPRSKSMGAAGYRLREVASAATISRTPSRDSLASYDESSIASDEGATRCWSFGSSMREDRLLEDARSQLMRLSTAADRSPLHNDSDLSTRSLSQPGSPPSFPTYRKYSDCGPQLRIRRLQGHRASIQLPSTSDCPGPVDLSCKKKKFECGNGLPYSRPNPPTSRHMASNASLDEGIDDDSASECSLLKSILIGRVRSNSMSVVSGRRPNLALEFDINRQFQRRHVTLAKKNLLPVIARISDLLNKIAEFIRALPCFAELSVTDQKTLLGSACPRLLLLDMARSNVEFAVTTIQQSGNQLVEEEAAGEDMSMPGGSASSGHDSEMPTQQFVDTVRSFIRKCQQFGITSEEYRFMRMITLFQLGGATLDRSDLADAVNCEARQRLQDLVRRTHPNEKLRYSSLLLTLHTLFGIHCGMLQALLYRPTSKAASFDDYVWNALASGDV